MTRKTLAFAFAGMLAFYVGLFIAAARFAETRNLHSSTDFDGPRLYATAYEKLVQEHYMLTPGVVQQATIDEWKAHWEHAFTKEQLATQEGADQAVLEMMSSLHTRWDKYYVPAEHAALVPEAAVAQARLLGQLGDVRVVEMSPGIYAVRINQFDEGTAQAFHQGLLLCKEPKAIILDLAGNPGGDIREAVQCLQMLVPSGTVCIERSHQGGGTLVERHHVLETNGYYHETYELSSGGTLKLTQRRHSQRYPQMVSTSVPITVVVNGHSASAAELVTAALQKLRKATVVGKRTFGKGVFQHVTPLPYGRFMALTAGEYRIDPQVRIHGVGIAPDFDPIPEKEDNQEAYRAFIHGAYNKAKEKLAEIEKWKARVAVDGAVLPAAADPWTIGSPSVESEYDRQSPAKGPWRTFALLVLVTYIGTVSLWAFFKRLEKRRLARSQKVIDEIVDTGNAYKKWLKLKKLSIGRHPKCDAIAVQALTLATAADDINNSAPPALTLAKLCESVRKRTTKLNDWLCQVARTEAVQRIAEADQALADNKVEGDHVAEAMGKFELAEQVLRIADNDAGRFSAEAGDYVKALEAALAVPEILARGPTPPSNETDQPCGNEPPAVAS